MNCQDARPWLSAMLDDELGSAERAAIDAHLAGCAECRAELARLESTVALLRALPPVRAPEGFVERVVELVPPPARDAAPPWRARVARALGWPWRMPLPAGAMAVALVAVAVAYVYQRSPELQDATRFEQPAPPTASRSQDSSGKAVAPPPSPVPAGRAAEQPGKPGAPASPAPPGPDPPAPARRELAKEHAREARDPKPDAKEEATTDVRADVQKRPSGAPDATTAAPAERAATPAPAAATAPAAAPPAPAPQPASPAPPASSAPPAPAPVPAPPSVAAPAPGESAPPAGAMGERPQSPPAAAGPAVRQRQVASEKAAARAAALAPVSAAVGKLAVDDLAEGTRRLDEIARRLQARELARRIEDDGLVVELMVPATAYADLERELSGIGRWTVLTPPAAAGQPVRLQIRLGP